jgi:hypothetical protein
METGPEPASETTENPAAVADAEQHARQQIEGLLRARAAARPGAYAWPVAAVSCVLVSGWLIRRWLRRR